MIPSMQIEHPKSLVEIVEDRLRNAIVNGELVFGQPLVEDRLGELFGVSRTPLREAMGRLEAQGLIVSVPKKGSFVFVPTESDFRDLCDFRFVLEFRAIRLALVHDKSGLLSELKEKTSLMSAALAAGDKLAYAAQDTAFHEGFFAHSGSKYFTEAYRAVRAQISAIRTYLSVPLDKEQKRSLGEHRALIRAITADDVEKAEAILTTHIGRAYTTYVQVDQARSAEATDTAGAGVAAK